MMQWSELHKCQVAEITAIRLLAGVQTLVLTLVTPALEATSAILTLVRTGGHLLGTYVFGGAWSGVTAIRGVRYPTEYLADGRFGVQGKWWEEEGLGFAFERWVTGVRQWRRRSAGYEGHGPLGCRQNSSRSGGGGGRGLQYRRARWAGGLVKVISNTS